MIPIVLFLAEATSVVQAAHDSEPEPIVVTAQRRPESPEDVPIALSVLPGSELRRLQISGTPDLDKVVPSLHMTRTGAFTQPFLRGVGKRSTLGVENSVATYVDGVYLASSIGALLDLRAIERVEVLNGPQGTLFGRNTTGGVIQLITRDPSPDFSGEVEFEAGSYGHARGDLYVTGGSDRLAGNVAVSASRNAGYGTNHFNGRKGQGEVDHNLVGRSKWVWRPAGDLKLTFAGDYQDTEHDFTQLPAKGFRAAGNPSVTGFRDGDQDAPSRSHFKYGGGSVRVDVGLGSLSAMSLSSARHMRAHYNFDLDAGPASLISADATARQTQFSQEIQLQSSPSARLRCTAGLYYIDIEERYAPTLFQYGGSYSAQLGGRVLQTLADEGDVSSYAAYGQATLPLGKSTRLTAGLRYTVEHRKVRAQGEREFSSPPFVRPISPLIPLLSQDPIRKSVKFSAPTWRLSVDHDLSGNVLGYLSVSRGVQSGGWNLQTPQFPAFEPETLDDFEGGLKYLSVSGRLSADFSAFYYDYADLQASAITPDGSRTTNATSARIYGLGLNIGARPDDRTNLTFGVHWLRARYEEFLNATCTNYSQDAASLYLPVQCDVSGNSLPLAPKLKANLAASHEVRLGSGALLLSGNAAYNSGYFSEPDNIVRQKAFATIDVSAEWNGGRQWPSLRLWVSNLTNTHYYDGLVTFPTTGVLQRPAAPRRIGASLGYSF